MKDPYKILETPYSHNLLDSIGCEFNHISPTKSLTEKAFCKVFWGQVGLSGFTLYPTLLNYSENRELMNLSKRLLSYFFRRIDGEASIEKEMPICLLSFALIGFKLYKINIDKYTLSCVPKFIFRSLTKFSFHDAQISMAKESDENSYRDLQFIITSCYALLVYAYQKHGLTDFIKNSTIEIADSYKRTLSVLQLFTFRLRTCLADENAKNIFELLSNKSMAFSKISETSISNEMNQLAQSESKEIIESVKVYELDYIYKLKEYSSLSYSELVEKIKDNYFRYICPSYTYLLDQSGKYYDEMIHLNVKQNKWRSLYEFDHSLVYMLAGWIKDNRSYSCLSTVSKDQLASDITNYILNYISNHH